MPHDDSGTTDPQTAKKKKQLGIIALLLLGLLIAVSTQPADPPDTAPTLAKPLALKIVDSKSLVDEDVPLAAITSTRELSRIEFDRVLQTNLFHVPAPEPEPEAGAEVEVVEQEAVPEVKVQAIYGNGRLTGSSQSRGLRVLIGREIVRPGETLRDGREIISVSANGVELGSN